MAAGIEERPVNERFDPMTGYVHTMYALHALAGLMGVTSGATIIGAFVFGLPSIVAIIMNYARRDAVRGSWLESHFHWQRRTFWFALIIGFIHFRGALILVLLGVVSLASTPLTGGSGALGAGAAIGGAFVALYARRVHRRRLDPVPRRARLAGAGQRASR